MAGEETREEKSVMVMREASRRGVRRDYLWRVVQASLLSVGLWVLVVSVVCEGVWSSSIQVVEVDAGQSPELW